MRWGLDEREERDREQRARDLRTRQARTARLVKEFGEMARIYALDAEYVTDEQQRKKKRSVPMSTYIKGDKSWPVRPNRKGRKKR